MKLVELNPKWCGYGGSGITGPDGNPVPSREGIGITFECPCGKVDHFPDSDTIFVGFANPLDGGPSAWRDAHPLWTRQGDTFEMLTLTPSILRTLPEGCKWHGFITNGEVIKA